MMLQTLRPSRRHAQAAKQRKRTVPSSSTYAPTQVTVVAGCARSLASFVVDVPTVSSCVLPPIIAISAPTSVRTTEATPAPAKKRSVLCSCIVGSSFGSESWPQRVGEEGRGGRDACRSEHHRRVLSGRRGVLPGVCLRRLDGELQGEQNRRDPVAAPPEPDAAGEEQEGEDSSDGAGVGDVARLPGAEGQRDRDQSVADG